MSEQDKRNAIPVDGKVDDVEAKTEPEQRKENFFKRTLRNRKVRKGLRIVGGILERGAILVFGMALGKTMKNNPSALPAAEPMEPATEMADNSDDDLLSDD